MVFNSFVFLVFFSMFFIIYWLFANKNVKQQNLLLLAASYVFYAWADVRLLAFLIAVSFINFLLGLALQKELNEKNKKIILYLGLFQCIGFLVFFKYFNFFISSFNQLFTALNIHWNLQTLNLIIPLGISFFTFRMISYLLDVFKGKINACNNWIIFFNYVSFFPLVVSGPIDKAQSFIPQLEQKRIFNYNKTVNGLRQILWGLFKKIVVADNCMAFTDQIFDNYHAYPASSLLLCAFLFAIQVYSDFSGYSDMAIGFSRIIGFNISKNFNFPYFAQNIPDFWRRWHISLTTWITEYIYTPLSIAFRDFGTLGAVLAVLINLTIVGIWHGANWNFILYGFIHGCFFVPLILLGTINKKTKHKKRTPFVAFKECVNIAKTFTLIMLTFIIFKSKTIVDALNYYKALFSKSLFTLPNMPQTKILLFTTLLFVFIMLVVEWIQKEKEHALQLNNKQPFLFHLIIYYVLIFCIVLFGANAENQFIYFKF